MDVRGSVYIEGNEQNTGVLHVHDNNSYGEPIARFTANGDGFILIENTKSETDYDECGVVIKGSSSGGYWLVGTDDTSALEIKYNASDFHFSGGYGLSVATNGNVGIGNTNPTQKLDIQNGNIILSGSYNAYTYIGDTNWGTGVVNSGSTYYNEIRGYWNSGNNRGFRLYNSHNNTIPLFVNSNGNVGIGTTNPVEKLDVNGEIRTNSGFKVGSSTRLYKDHLDFNYNGAFHNWGSVRWGCGNFQSGSYGRLYLTSIPSGIGVPNVGNPLMRFDCYNFFYINRNCYAPAFVNTSDLRMKKNINNINSDVSLNKILQLSPISYDFIDETKGTKLFGFVAQDLINIIPEAVTTRGGYLPTIMKSFKYELNKIFINEEEILNKIEVNKYYAIGNSQLDSFTPYKILEKDLNSITIENPENNSFGEETVYIYGECSNDINSINYNHISVLNSGSIQELYKIIQNQQKTIDDLLNRISILENPK